jgi:sugar lactone lactonase YvrE
VTLDGTRTQLFSGIIDSQSEHQVNDIRVGPDGMMYVASGQAANAAVLGIDNAPWIMRSPGVRARPCQDYVLTGRNFQTPDFRTEDMSDVVRTGAFVTFGTPTAPGQVIPGTNKCGGSILVFDPANPEATLRPFVHGLRNVIGLAWSDAGEMYTAVNGYDNRGSRPVNDQFDGSYRVREGTWYGYPDFSARLEPLTNPVFDAPGSLMAPVFVGDVKQPESLDFVIDHAASGLEPPDRSLILGLHQFNSSPSLLDVAPRSWGELAGQVFTAEWGDLAPPTNPLLDNPAGFRITRTDPDTGLVVPFVRNAKPGPASAQGAAGRGIERPFDVKFGPDGAMYIADYGIVRINPASPGDPYEFPPGTGAIWKVTSDGTASFANGLDDACPPAQPGVSGLRDIAGSVHERAIACIASYGITRGGPAGATSSIYGPQLAVRRDQMASFLVRLLDSVAPGLLPAVDATNRFPCAPDPSRALSPQNVHYGAIQRLAAAGIVSGGPEGRPPDCFGADLTVTRAQMASLINGAQEQVFSARFTSTRDFYADVAPVGAPAAEGPSVHYDAINAITAEGVALGTRPNAFEPAGTVTRAQMASFLARKLEFLVDNGSGPRPGG